MIKYGINWRMLASKDGFLKPGKDQRVGLADNPNMRAVAEVIGSAAGHDTLNGPVIRSKFNKQMYREYKKSPKSWWLHPMV